MLEIIYRIYEVADEEQATKNIEDDANMHLYSSSSRARNKEIVMDCMIVDSREQFKQIIKDSYGPDTPFRCTNKLKPGDVYCIIIGEHCYNTEKYFRKVEYDCALCGSHVTTFAGYDVSFYDSELKYDLFNMLELKDKKFCSDKCKQKWKRQQQKLLKPDENTHFFVTKDMFSEQIAGYIYKITKKSTNEFYVGQTQYAPMFRWAEHMKTDRFPISNVNDYMFEVLEIVSSDENLLEREKHWIQTCFKQAPQLSLNVSQTQLLRKDLEPNKIN